MLDVRQTAAFSRWLHRLRDDTAAARIVRRIERLRQGHFGDVRSLGAGVHELRVDHGPGYRVYFVQRGTALILLLGGDKRSQRRDIAHAMAVAARLEN